MLPRSQSRVHFALWPEGGAWSASRGPYALASGSSLGRATPSQARQFTTRSEFSPEV